MSTFSAPSFGPALELDLAPATWIAPLIPVLTGAVTVACDPASNGALSAFAVSVPIAAVCDVEGTGTGTHTSLLPCTRVLMTSRGKVATQPAHTTISGKIDNDRLQKHSPTPATPPARRSTGTESDAGCPGVESRRSVPSYCVCEGQLQEARNAAAKIRTAAKYAP